MQININDMPGKHQLAADIVDVYVGDESDAHERFGSVDALRRAHQDVDIMAGTNRRVLEQQQAICSTFDHHIVNPAALQCRVDFSQCFFLYSIQSLGVQPGLPECLELSTNMPHWAHAVANNEGRKLVTAVRNALQQLLLADFGERRQYRLPVGVECLHKPMVADW